MAGLGEQVFEQHFAEAAALGFGGDGQAGDFAAFGGFGEGFEGGAAVDLAVVFEDEEAADVGFEVFAAAVDEDAGLFQRADEGDEGGDVACGGGADGGEGILGDGCAGAAAGEEFADECAVAAAGEDLAAGHAAGDGFEGGAQEVLLGGKDAALLQEGFGFLGGEVGEAAALFVQDAFFFDEEEEFFGFEGAGGGAGGFGHGKVEGFAAEGGGEGADEGERAAVEGGFESPGVGVAHASGVAHVDAVDDADGAGADEVAGCGAQAAAAGGLGEADGEGGGDVGGEAAADLFGDFEDFGCGDAAVAVVAGLDAGLVAGRADLAAAAVDEDEADAEGGEEGEVGGDGAEGAGVEQAAGNADHQGFAAQPSDIWGGFAEVAGKGGEVGSIHRCGSAGEQDVEELQDEDGEGDEGGERPVGVAAFGRCGGGAFGRRGQGDGAGGEAFAVVRHGGGLAAVGGVFEQVVDLLFIEGVAPAHVGAEAAHGFDVAHAVGHPVDGGDLLFGDEVFGFEQTLAVGAAHEALGDVELAFFDFEEGVAVGAGADGHNVFRFLCVWREAV